MRSICPLDSTGRSWSSEPDGAREWNNRVQIAVLRKEPQRSLTSGSSRDRHPAFPFDAGQQYESALCAAPSLSAAVAEIALLGANTPLEKITAVSNYAYVMS